MSRSPTWSGSPAQSRREKEMVHVCPKVRSIPLSVPLPGMFADCECASVRVLGHINTRPISSPCCQSASLPNFPTFPDFAGCTPSRHECCGAAGQRRQECSRADLLQGRSLTWKTQTSCMPSICAHPTRVRSSWAKRRKTARAQGVRGRWRASKLLGVGVATGRQRSVRHGMPRGGCGSAP
jgi:hypothetical protein